MKTDIHPEYQDLKVSCHCGNTFTTRSTYEGGSLNVEICASCHPFYTGKQKLMDTARQVDKFRKRYEKSAAT